MEPSRNTLMPRKKTFWKMVRTMFIPAQNIAKLMVGCGGKRGKGKRRLAMKNMQLAKEAFMHASFQGAEHFSSTRQSHTETRSGIQTTNLTVDSTRAENGGINDILDTDNPASESILHPQQQAYYETPETNQPCTNTTTLPAPVNLQEAQVLLESLNLCEQPCPNLTEQLVTSQGHSEGVDGNMNALANPLNESTVQSTCETENTNCIINSIATVQNQECSNNGPETEENNCNNQSTPINSTNSNEVDTQVENENQQVILRRKRVSSTGNEHDFSGWRKSSIEVAPTPPVTLAFIPSGLCVGDRVVWVKDDQPEIGTVRWIGKIRQQFYAGIEFDKPVGNSSGIYGYGFGMYKRLFTCQLAYGRFIPVKELVLYKDYHDTGIRSGIVCVICRDDFLDSWEPDTFSDGTETTCGDDLQPFNMVSTKCGHLYHWGCLDQWFSAKKRTEFHCPFCSRSMDRDDVIRIFPSQV